jgi:glycosyltransferase involved in cell wall biosynthesis
MFQEIASKTGKIDVVCFGDNDWWYHNRGHMDIQLMRCFAKQSRVLYVNSIVIRKFNVQEGMMFLRRLVRKLRSIMRGMKSVDIENMTVYSPFSMPVHHIRFARSINEKVLSLQIRHCMRWLNMENPIIWVACPGAAKAAVTLPHCKIVYQRSDRYETFPGVDSKQVAQYDKFLKKHADLVVYVNRELMRQEESECKKAIYLDHGVDYDFFSKANQDNEIPDEMRRIPHPIMGFYGSIDDHTSDLSLIEKLADLLEDVSIVLIGDSSIDLSTLARRKNVYLLGKKPYEQIPYYARCFDVCFMAWRENEWIKACNPIKLKEYLAIGKPIVSTPFNELDKYKDLVYSASSAEAFAEAVRRACNENDATLVSARKNRVSYSSWSAKATEVLNTLYEMS